MSDKLIQIYKERNRLTIQALNQIKEMLNDDAFSKELIQKQVDKLINSIKS